MSTRILIADDSDFVRARVRQILRNHEGWEVCGEAANGETAISKAIDLCPDVLVLDLMMPDMDGLQVAREIGNNARRPPCILLYTLHVVPGLTTEAKMLGIEQVVSKSDIQALVAAIETQSQPAYETAPSKPGSRQGAAAQ